MFDEEKSIQNSDDESLSTSNIPQRTRPAGKPIWKSRITTSKPELTRWWTLPGSYRCMDFRNAQLYSSIKS